MALVQLVKELEKLKSQFKKKKTEYHIPGVWLDINNSNEEVVDPFDFFLDQINKIKALDKIQEAPLQVYNMFIRYTCAYEHQISNPDKKWPEESFRDQGTFLKAIALIPYLRSLGVNTIHLLPITKIGVDGKKGDLGSPYAIRNHYELDEGLCEPILDMTPEEQFQAFMDACKEAGIKVILEFVFRTASIDNDLAIEKPEWFYWIKGTSKLRTEDTPGGFGPPQFSKRDLKKIEEMIEEGTRKKLPEPDSKYQAYYTGIPVKVARVDLKIMGLLTPSKKPLKSNECIIAPAFADWPPNDNQPLWTDVTYLRLFDDAKFNYMAYNTVRMYDEELMNEDNILEDLWEYLEGILPYYIGKFNIDGAMIDMGHALPTELRSRIINKAKSINSEFIFWEENFIPTQESKEEGYSAASGYMVFDALDAGKMRSIISSNSDFPLDFFATPENHNTPRAFYKSNDKRFSELIFTVMKLMPQITYIHSGFELFETQPVNTGLGFSDEEIEKFPSEELPLFSFKEMNWNKNDLIKRIVEINYSINRSTKAVELVDDPNGNFLCFNSTNDNGDKYLFIGNISKEMSKVSIERNGELILSNKSRSGDDVFNSYEYELWKI